MGFVATLSIDHPDLVLMPTIETHPDVTIRYEYSATAAQNDLCFVSVFGGEYDAIEETMVDDHTVSNPTHVATFENRAIYRITVETELDLLPEKCAAYGVFVFRITSGEGDWMVRTHMPDRDALTAFQDYCRSHSISFRMTQLYDSMVSDDGTYFLTEQQHEILSMAYYAGYYEIPRAVSQDYLAEKLGISTSAVSQRHRRAVAELIAATLENDRTPGRRNHR